MKNDKIKIFIIDDIKKNLRDMTFFLNLEDEFEVSGYYFKGDMEEAVECALTNDYDLLLLDTLLNNESKNTPVSELASVNIARNIIAKKHINGQQIIFYSLMSSEFSQKVLREIIKDCSAYILAMNTVYRKNRLRDKDNPYYNDESAVKDREKFKNFIKKCYSKINI